MPSHSEQIKTYLTKGQLDLAVKTLVELARGTYYESDSILLSGQFHGLEREIAQMLISEESKRIQSSRLRLSAEGLLQHLIEEIPAQMGADVEGNSAKSPVSAGPQTIIHNTTNIYTETYIQGNQTNNQSLIQQHIHPLQQLIEVEQQAGDITREEYEELLDILAEIQEQKQPSERQQKKWKRWLGKAAETGKKFVGGRLEKGVDSGLSQWLKEGGLDKVMEYVGALG